MIVSTALLCLSLNIYHEARSEFIPGQYAVALVTMNRAQDEDRVCREVFKDKQFSWANKGVEKVKGGWRIAKSLVPKDAVAWERAVIIANHTLNGKMPDFTRGSDHYHTKAVRPGWAKESTRVRAIGYHVFYKLSQE